jgi:rod shape determining protein RodA
MAQLKRTSILGLLDWPTVLLYLLLMGLGWVNIYSAVYTEGQEQTFDFASRYGRQLIWIMASVGLAIITMLIDSKFYTLFSFVFYGSVLFLLIAVLLFGTTVNGATSWFQVGPIRIQPAEFAKFATSLAIARYLSSHNLNPKKISTLIYFSAIALFPAVLILFQNDTGSALVFFSLFIVFFREGMPSVYLLLALLGATLFILSLLVPNHIVLFLIQAFALLAFHIIYRKRVFSLIAGAIMGGVAIVALLANKYLLNTVSLSLYIIVGTVAASLFFIAKSYKFKLNQAYIILLVLFGSFAFTYSVDYVFNDILDDHQQKRINNLLGIESDPYGAGYNVNQSKIAIGSGGPSGKGFLNGTQTKFKFVPEQSTDFIFCTVGEEWGYLGTSSTILLFLFLLIRLITLAERQKTKFARIYGYSVAMILFFHVAVNIGMTIGLAPVIGIPLPFFSYGGSSLWGFTFLLFIFLKFDVNRNELIN